MRCLRNLGLIIMLYIHRKKGITETLMPMSRKE